MFGTIFIIIYPFLAYIPFRLALTYGKRHISETAKGQILSWLITIAVLPSNTIAGLLLKEIIRRKKVHWYLFDIERIFREAFIIAWWFSLLTLASALFISYLAGLHFKNGRKGRFIIAIIYMSIYAAIAVIAGYHTAEYRLWFGWE